MYSFVSDENKEIVIKHYFYFIYLSNNYLIKINTFLIFSVQEFGFIIRFQLSCFHKGFSSAWEKYGRGFFPPTKDYAYISPHTVGNSHISLQRPCFPYFTVAQEDKPILPSLTICYAYFLKLNQ